MASQQTNRTEKQRTVFTGSRSNPDAAGIDLGATVHYAAVPAGRDENPVRHFGTLTEDLIALADWLGEWQKRGIAVRRDILREEACAVLKTYGESGLVY